MDANLHHGHGRQCVSCIRNRGRLDQPYDAGRASRGRREVGRYMCCWCGVAWEVEGGGGLPARRHSYRRHRGELLRIADWLKNDKNKHSRQLGCTWALFGKTGTKRFRPMEGLVGCVFYSMLVCTFSWPQTDKVYLSLVTALSKLLDLKKIGKLVGKMMKSYFSKFRQNRKAVKI